MYHQEAEELSNLLFSFMGIFHKKIVSRFRRHDDNILGMKKNHAKIMIILLQNKCLLPSEIGMMLDIEKGSVTTLIDQLEMKNLVTRRRDPNDRRKSQITLSETGEKAMTKVIDMHIHELENMLGGMDAREVRKYLKSMNYAVSFMQKL